MIHPEDYDRTTAIRLTRVQRQWLDKEAERLDRSLSWLIRQAVDLMIESRKPNIRTSSKTSA